MKKRFKTKRALIRKIEDQRDTIARLVDANVEKDKEISELRELLGAIEQSAKGIDRYAKAVTGEAVVIRQLIRNYRQEHGVYNAEG